MSSPLIDIISDILSEKDSASLPQSTAHPQRTGTRKTWRITTLILLVLACFHYGLYNLRHDKQDGVELAGAETCAQPASLVPSKNGKLWSDVQELYGTDDFLGRAVEWLGGAVRVPTQSFDKMLPVGEDPRWEVFGPFHDYLLTAFPNVHTTLKLTKVNTWGLVYVWEGSDASLKPLLLAAHQDVVPVNAETADEWTHPPFSGYFDGERIWGRGSSDDKSGLIGLMTTVETLIQNGFKPTRSVFLAFGFDEEASGIHGASSIGKYLFETYGENYFSMLVDEGGDYMIEFGKAFATVGTAEKGYLDVRVEVTSPGGHSSVPPVHTSIGILSSLLVHVERNPYVPKLNRDTPMYLKSQCLAAHAPELPKSLRSALKKSVKSDRALKKAQDALFKDIKFKALVGTTSAIDLIQGGVKTNALPESAWAVVNHRIATDSSVEEVMERDTDLYSSLAHKFNLTYTAFGKQVTGSDKPAYGTLTLSDAWGAALAPAPITPTLDDEATPFKLLAGTIKATHNAQRNLTEDDNVIVSPGIMSGNTDTRYYWKLTPHIFRYSHSWSGTRSWLTRGVHTVNEAMYADSFVEMIRFFTTLILNADEASI